MAASQKNDEGWRTIDARSGRSPLSASDRFRELLNPLVGQMGVDDEERMKHARNPKAEREKQVQDRLEWLAAEQDRDGRKDDGQKVTHRVTPLFGARSGMHNTS